MLSIALGKRKGQQCPAVALTLVRRIGSYQG